MLVLSNNKLLYGTCRIWEKADLESGVNLQYLRKNNLMQICSVISEWRVPGKQGCRALWLDVSERSGGESSSFVAGLPA
jgi:hypothetical protein